MRGTASELAGYTGAWIRGYNPGMPAGGICPQCRGDVPPVARFCAQCGLQLVAREAPVIWGFTKLIGMRAGILLAVLLVGGLFLFGLHAVDQQVQPSQAAQQNSDATEAQRQQIQHANDPWWDAGQPDGFKATFFGKEYVVEPGSWTSIDVRSPAWSERYRYVVALEGINRFRARPDGFREREFVFPNPQNLQPYQMTGWCQTLLVQPLDSGVYRVRVKYMRIPRGGG